jgi:hypothetical protein
LLVHVIRSPNFYCSCFNNPYKKFVKQEYFYEKHFVEWKNESSKPDKNSSLRRVECNPKPKIKMMFKNFISGCLPWSYFTPNRFLKTCFLYVLYSTLLHLAAPQIPLCRRMLDCCDFGIGKSDALTTRLNLIYNSARSHPQSSRSPPHSARFHPQVG